MSGALAPAVRYLIAKRVEIRTNSDSVRTIMVQKLDDMPLTVGDLVRLLPVVVRDLAIDPGLNRVEARQALRGIGERLLEMSGKTTDERSRLILAAVAKELIDIEHRGA